jgi:predicted GTPase
MPTASTSNVLNCADTYVEELQRIQQMSEGEIREYAIHMLGLHAKASLDDQFIGTYLWHEEACLTVEQIHMAITEADRAQGVRQWEYEFRLTEASHERYMDEVEAVKRALLNRLGGTPSDESDVRSSTIKEAQLKSMDWKDLRALADSKEALGCASAIAEELLRRLSDEDQNARHLLKELGLFIGVRC